MLICFLIFGAWFIIGKLRQYYICCRCAHNSRRKVDSFLFMRFSPFDFFCSMFSAEKYRHGCFQVQTLTWVNEQKKIREEMGLCWYFFVILSTKATTVIFQISVCVCVCEIWRKRWTMDRRNKSIVHFFLHISFNFGV